MSIFFQGIKGTGTNLPPLEGLVSVRSDRPTYANSVDSVNTPQNMASDPGEHCLPLSRQF